MPDEKTTAGARKPAQLPNGLYAWEPLPGNANFIYPQILEYFQHGIDVGEGSVVIDAGAHIGVFALEVLRRSGGKARLFCFEPAPNTHSYLQRNVSEQFPDADVHTLRKGLSSEPGETTLYFRPLAPQMTGLTEEYPEGENLEAMVDLMFDPEAPEEYRRLLPAWLPYVPRFITRSIGRWRMRKAVATIQPVPCELETVSRIIREHELDRVDLLKVDVEGAELDVLLGIDEPDWPKVRAAAMEVHDADGRVAKIQELFRSKGFDKITVDQEYIFKGTPFYGIFAVRSSGD